MLNMADGMTSMVACVIMLLLVIVYSVMWVKSPQKVGGEYKEVLVKEGKSPVVFELLYFLTGPIAGIVDYMLCDVSCSAVFVIVYASLLLLFLFFSGTVFRKTRERVRVQGNLLTILLMQLTYLLSQLSPSYSIGAPTNMQLMLPASVPLLLGLNLLVNLAFLTYLTVKCVASRLKDKEQERVDAEEKEHHSERNEEEHKIYNNSLNTPLQSIVAHKYRTRFIDDGEKEGAPLNPKEETFKVNIEKFLAE